MSPCAAIYCVSGGEKVSSANLTKSGIHLAKLGLSVELILVSN